MIISILLAVRNESEHIMTCLEHLENLTLPQGVKRVEICIGNDNSEDDTWEKLIKYCGNNSKYQIFNISPSEKSKPAKAGVLAFLAKRAKGDYLFFTDADIKTPKNWLWAHLQIHRNTLRPSIVNGITYPIGNNWLANFQTIDWWFALQALSLLSLLGISPTAMGNNMSMPKQLYQDIGGYEATPDSIAEDFELSQLHLSKKGKIYQQSNFKADFALTLPEKTWVALIQQRTRWLKGALRLSIVWRSMFILSFFIIPLLMIYSPILFVGYQIIKAFFWLFQFPQSLINKKLIFCLLVYELYYIFIYGKVLANHFLNKKIVWKGLNY